MSNVSILLEKIKQGKTTFSEDDVKVIRSLAWLFRHVHYEKLATPFICGEAGEKDRFKLPEYFFVCPSYGMDGYAVYKKDKEYNAPRY